MQNADRLHALDAVRAYALLGGIVLHATMSFLPGFPEGLWVWVDTPSTTLAVLFYVIHIFRMPLFFLIAGFFGRMVIERRGMGAFVRDRAKRIVLPLVLSLIIVSILTVVAVVAAAILVGIDLEAYAASFAVAEAEVPPGYFPWGHLWFLYYLVIFYVGAIGARSLAGSIAGAGSMLPRVDGVLRFCLRGPWGVLLLAAPAALYFYRLESWAAWTGLPAPFLIYPEIPSIVGYGVPFAFGWLAHRQLHLLMSLDRNWIVYTIPAVVLTVVCLSVAGLTPVWEGPFLAGTERLIYTASYMVGQWCWMFAFIGFSVKYLSKVSPVRRYLADSSYWLYLMHIPVLAFFHVLLGPLAWHWSVKYLVSILGCMPILLLSYHYMVRFTWIGAMLNGRRHPRPGKPSSEDAALAPG